MELATQNIIAAVVGIIVAWIVIKLIWDKYKGGDREGIFDSVDPWVQLAVSVAFRASEKNYKETGELLSGEEKRKIANGLYDTLPDEIGGINIDLLKHTVLTRAVFSGLVETAYRMADEYSNPKSLP